MEEFNCVDCREELDPIETAFVIPHDDGHGGMAYLCNRCQRLRRARLAASEAIMIPGLDIAFGGGES